MEVWIIRTQPFQEQLRKHVTANLGATVQEEVKISLPTAPSRLTKASGLVQVARTKQPNQPISPSNGL
eukprot:scaffold76643_cov19-Tisochrysis_lutea.AAC.1